MSDVTPEVMRVPHLPDEIILHIVSKIPNISTLLEIIQIVDERILEDPCWRCVRPFITRHPLQIQRLIRFVMCVRYGHVSGVKDLARHLRWNLEKRHPPPPATFSKWKQFQLKMNNKLPIIFAEPGLMSVVPPFLILDCVHDPITMLKDMRMVSDDLEHLVHSFFNDRLRRTHAKMRDALIQEYHERYRHCNGTGHSKAMHEKHWGPDYCLKRDATDAPATEILPMPIISLEPATPSPTEFHRIRRAFWRLLLYSDLFHEPNSRYPIPRTGEHTEATYAFIRFLTVWELEEMECAYHHLQAQVDECADLDSPFYSPDLANRLRTTFGLPPSPPDRPHSNEYPGHPIANRHITDSIDYHRDIARHDAVIAWPDTQAANTPNAGWQYLQEHESHHQLVSRTLPLRCFLDWGYCIWDPSRLDSWWLIDRKGNRFLAGKGKWEWWCLEKCETDVCGYCERLPADLFDDGECACDSERWQGRRKGPW